MPILRTKTVKTNRVFVVSSKRVRFCRNLLPLVANRRERHSYLPHCLPHRTRWSLVSPLPGLSFSAVTSFRSPTPNLSNPER